MDSVQETRWRGSGETDHNNSQTPKRTAMDSSRSEDNYSSPNRAVDMPEITEKSKEVQVETKGIERQNSEDSGLAQGNRSRSSTKREPPNSSTPQGPDSKSQLEIPAPATKNPLEDVQHTRQHRSNLISKIWSFFPWSRSSSLSYSSGKQATLQLYFKEPYIITLPTGGVAIKWDMVLQAIDQRHISEELCRDERSRRTSLVEQLAQLRDGEGFGIQQWLKELPHEAVLESMVRRTRNIEHDGIMIKNIPSYRLIIRLLSNEEVEKLPANRNLPYKRSMGSEVSVRNPEPQVILSKRDAPSGFIPRLSLDRPTFVKIHHKHLEPETLDVYRLPWVWDHVSLSPLCLHIKHVFELTHSTARSRLHHHQTVDSWPRSRHSLRSYPPITRARSSANLLQSPANLYQSPPAILEPLYSRCIQLAVGV